MSARAEQGFCAACGEQVELAIAFCDGCQFIYCETHTDSDAHECTTVCVECDDDFDEVFWGEAPAHA